MRDDPGELVPLTGDVLKAMAQLLPPTAALAGFAQMIQNREQRRWRRFVNELVVAFDQELDAIANRLSDERLEELILHGLRKAVEATRDEQVRLLAWIVADGCRPDPTDTRDARVNNAHLLLEMAADLEVVQVELLAWIAPSRMPGGQTYNEDHGEYTVYQIERDLQKVQGFAEAVLYTLQARGLAERVELEQKYSEFGPIVQQKSSPAWRATSLGRDVLRYLKQVGTA